MPAYRFDVAFSFAGPHREKVRAIAELVAAKLGRERVFYDQWHEDELGGEDGDIALQDIYKSESLIVIADISDDYTGRKWCQDEAKAIRELRRSLNTATDKVLRQRLAYIRFDDGSVPGISETTIDWDARQKSPEQLAEVILRRHAKLVKALAERTVSSFSTQPVATSPTPAAPPILFFHPATNDALYSRRERELDWLEACAKDPRIRIATVTGVGGLGKTSLVGHWTKVRKGWQHRAFRGVFFYSFYSDNEPKHFFAAFLDFAYKSVGQNRPAKDGVLHRDAATLAQRWPFLIVLDGLEVLQADAEDSRYGWINDGELNEFVSRLGGKGQSLLVLTSRFPFPNVIGQFPDHTASLELEMFSQEEGADLLERCGLPEDRQALRAFSEQFGGHPLALRLFAGASMAAPATPPSELSREVMRAEKVSTLPDPDEPGIADDERQRRRHRRQFQKLLEWLQAKLPAPKQALLKLVALFREPAASGTLIALARGLDSMREEFSGLDSAAILSLLSALVGEHLLQREDLPKSDTPRWSAHPIVREVFRAAALTECEAIAQQFAKIVVGKGEGGGPKSVAELRPILEAIEVLLAVGDFEAADQMYRGRLKNGDVFKWIPAPQEGLSCARGFLEPRTRRAALEKALGGGRAAFYLNAVALQGSILGETEGIEGFWVDDIAITHAEDDWLNVSIPLQNIANAQTLRGALRDAVESASEALFYAGVEEGVTTSNATQSRPKRPASVPLHDAEADCNSRATRAHALSLAGELSAASREFAAADTISRKQRYDNAALGSIWSCRWCRHRWCLNDTVAARRLTNANRAKCERNGANADIARCDHLLADLDRGARNLDSATRRIGKAVRVFRDARMGQDLPDALLTQARLGRSVEDCEEALRLAARSGFALMQCDALNLRALLRCEAGEPGKAAEDAHQALEIADRCGYYWGRHEALRQLRDAAKALGNRADENHWNEAEKELSKRMEPLIKEALEIEHAHDREMEKRYGK
jgi:tetratricopeptide (TPR) repeat protein